MTTALDSYAKLSKWTFSGDDGTNTARFSTQFVQSVSYTRSVKAGDILPYMMLAPTNPPFSTWETLQSMRLGADNMNVNVFNYGSQNKSNGYVLTSDFWNIYEFDAFNLKTVGPVHPEIPGVPGFEKTIVLGCAHSLPEYGTSNYITFASLASAVPELDSKYLVYRTTGVKGREQIAEIVVDEISYIHSFALTKNHMILIAAPLFIDPMRIFRSLDPEDGFKWVGDESVKMHVVDLKTGFLNTFETENFFFLHHVNSFENDDGQIIIDLCTYKNGDALRIMDLKNLHNSTTRSMFKAPELKRYTINPRDKTVNVNTFINGNVSVPFANKLDFPTINENFRYQKYCYIYGVVYSVNTTDFLDMALVKKDVCTGKTDKYWYKPGNYFNEAFFVARPGSVDEDDGVLLVNVLDTATQESQIVLFDAKTLEITNSATLPTNIPFGTHGRFFPEVI